MLTPHPSHLAFVRPRSPLINPRSQQADLLRREPLALRRHDDIRLQARDKMQEPAAGAVARQDDLAVVAALKRG